MSKRGAYVATPAPSPSVPDIPPGWPEDWADSFPNALPPGYTPTCGLDFAVPPTPESMKYDETITIEVYYTDQDDWPVLPYFSDRITFTATLDGATIWSTEYGNDPLGGGYYGKSLSKSFSSLTEEDNGKTLYLEASGTCLGQPVSASTEIEIGERYAILLSLLTSSLGIHYMVHHDVSQPGFFGFPAAWIWRYQDGTGGMDGASPLDEAGVFAPTDDGSPWIVEATGNPRVIGTKIIKFDEEITYGIAHVGISGEENPCAYTMTFTIYEPDGTVVEEYEKSVSIPAGDDADLENWLLVNGETQEVTVVNP